MSRYVLGLREPEGRTDLAKPCLTAQEAVAAVENWRANRGTVTVILRGGKPINETTLRKDVRTAERRLRHSMDD